MDKDRVKYLRNLYSEVGLFGIVSLIDYLEESYNSGKVILRIGSATVDLNKLLERFKKEHPGKDALGLIMTLPTFSMGSNDGSETPLDWLESFSKTIPEIESWKLKKFDLLFYDLAKESDWEFIHSKIKVVKEKITEVVH